MSKTSGLYRVGRDVELRYLNDGTAVANVSLAFNYGKKGQDGNRPTQWTEGTLFGQRAETLAPMLTKGSQHVFHLSDVHIETYQKQDGGEGFKLSGRIDDVELTDRRDAPAQQPQRQSAPQQQRPQGNQQYQQRPPQRAQAAPAQRQAPAPQAGGFTDDGFSDMDSDVPF